MIFHNTTEAAKDRWPAILEMLGVDKKYLKNVHGPCPVCGGKDRFRFDNKDGSGSFFCSNCGSGHGLKLLEIVHGWDFHRAMSEVNAVVAGATKSIPCTQQGQPEKIAAIKRLLGRSLAVSEGDPVWLYLLARLGQVQHGKLADLRYCQECNHAESGTRHPAMLGIIRGPSGSGVTVHRTYLTMDGHKAALTPPRKTMPGLSMHGAALRIGRPRDRLGIAEGIETALAASMLHRVPVWAAISAAGMMAWTPPVGITRVEIYGDNDASYTGHAAAYGLAKRLVSRGIECQVMIPEGAGSDWCDVLQARVWA